MTHAARSPSFDGRRPEDTFRSFAVDTRHLTTDLNVVASDMIRDREIVKKLDAEPDHFRKHYRLTDEEFRALRDRDLPSLFQLGLHPFLLVRFAGMVGILEYWQALGAPGRGNI